MKFGDISLLIVNLDILSKILSKKGINELLYKMLFV